VSDPQPGMGLAQFYWLKHDAALAQDEKALASVWKAKALDAEAALGFVAMPTTAPAYAKLVAENARYVSLADLESATAEELEAAGLSSREAEAVLAWFAALP
jgi:hypothetical protein